MRTYICVISMYGARSAVFVCTGRVLSITSQATRNLFVLEVSTGTVTCCFNSLFTGLVPCWFECSTQNKPYQQVRARTHVSWACVAHGLQCLCVRGACCPSLAKQLVIWVVVEVSTVTVICCYNSMCTGMYRVGMNVPLKTNRANKYAHVPLCRGRECRTVCSVCAYGARVVHHFPSNS